MGEIGGWGDPAGYEYENNRGVSSPVLEQPSGWLSMSDHARNAGEPGGPEVVPVAQSAVNPEGFVRKVMGKLFKRADTSPEVGSGLEKFSASDMLTKLIPGFTEITASSKATVDEMIQKNAFNSLSGVQLEWSQDITPQYVARSFDTFFKAPTEESAQNIIRGLAELRSDSQGLDEVKINTVASQFLEGYRSKTAA